jgi:leukotriene-A4 hydrolase
MARLDPHSYCDSAQPTVSSLTWKARVDFTTKTLRAEATLTFPEPASGALDLDTRELSIESVTDSAGRAVAFQLHAAEPILGAKLSLQLPAGTRSVTIGYRTAPSASALQWLEPAQTLGGQQPFLFSQCQAIHARSVVPLQDTPRVRLRYTAELTVPAGLTAVMAAASTGSRDGVFTFEMPQPIPPYLLAFAVGELGSRELGPRTRVWSEPGMLDRAAHEFAGVDAMLRAAEALFGPYDWDRFDLLVMPPSFPYGGMENPRLTFLTPTLVAGDRSLVNVVAHELAHSWTGNLVTNANAEHFWLNEGFTVFAERRILEALEGAEVASLHATLGLRSLEEALHRFAEHPELTKLRTQLEGVDPDEAFSVVPYEKGYLFLRALEESAGRPAFDRFLRAYLREFRFQSITTGDFLAVVRRELPGALEAVNAPAWLDGPGLPANAPRARSPRLDEVLALGTSLPGDAQVKGWTATEWQLYLESLPRPFEGCTELERRFGLTAAKNPEVLVAWLTVAIHSGYAPAVERAEKLLGEVGRMKYLRPLYLALHRKAPAKARQVFEGHRAGYHPIAQQVIDGVLKVV